MARHGAVGQLVHGEERRGRVARAAAQPGAHGNALLEREVHAEPAPVASSTMSAARTARFCSGGPTSAPSTSIVTPPASRRSARSVSARLTRQNSVSMPWYPSASLRKHAEEQVQLGVRLYA